NGEPVRIKLAKHDELETSGDISFYGPQSKIWMGVPLKTSNGTIGVVTVQSYHDENAFTDADLEVLMYVSENIAQAIERKRAEGQIKWQKNVLDATNKLLLETLKCETEEEIAITCLTKAQELTNSQIGFIGEINAQGTFDLIAMSDLGWENCRMERTNDVKLHKNMEIRGLWSKAIKSDSTQIVNLPKKDPDRVGLPKGHSSIETLISVPLKRSDNTIGVIVLANKKEGYDQDDQKALESLSVSLVEALIRKRSEDELLLEKTYLQQLFESSPEAIALVDNDGKILRINGEFTRLFGHTFEDAKGHSIDDFLAPDDLRAEAAELTRNVIAGEGVALESVRKRKDGSLVDVSILGTPIIIGEGQVAVYAIYRDITERKRAQAALILERQQLLSIFDSIDEIVYVCDPYSYELLYINEAGRKQLVLSDGETCYKALHDQDEPCSDCENELILSGKERGGISREYYNGSKQKWFRCMTKAISWPDREHRVRYEMAIDVTDRKENEKTRESILRINQHLLSELDINRALQGLSRELRHSVQHDVLAIAQINKEHDQIEVIYSKNDQSETLKAISTIKGYKGKFSSSLTEKILGGRKKATLTKIPAKGNGELQKLREIGMSSYLAVPLVNAGVTLGMLYVASSTTTNYNGKHNQILEQIKSQLVLWLQHHRLIEKLSDSEAKYRTLFNNSNDVIYILQGKKFVFVNRKFEELLEYTLEEVNHSDFDFLQTVAPESRAMIAERSRRAAIGDKLDTNYEFKGISKSGKIYDFDVSVSYVTYNGEPAVQGILRDISEKKQFADKEKEMQLELM
ncbi:PAS domain S-box protein, partial [bacterium]|nr:PAS domain S-box protein [bacterium]